MRSLLSVQIGLSAVLAAGLLAAAPVAAQTDVDDDPVDIHDPWEGMNRGIFWFNDKFDQYGVRPVAIVWDAIWPDPFEQSLSNLFRNARFPIVFLNDWLQWKPRAAGLELARFLVDSTFGLGGLFTPAKYWGIDSPPEDFGQTLGVWGVPKGPYLVLPLIGPSNPRDTTGLVVDSAAAVWPWFVPVGVSIGVAAGQAINFRSLYAETIDSERDAAFDWYAAVRNAHVQRRDNQVNDRDEDDNVPIDSGLYFLDGE